MSSKLMERVVALAVPLSHAAFRVLMVLAKHANDDGTRCFPSLETIGEMAQSPKRAVIRCLAQLSAAGLVSQETGGGRGKANHYRITLDGPGKGDMASPLPAVNGHTMSPFNPPKGDLKGDISARKGDLMSPDSIKTLRKKEGNKPFDGKEGSEVLPSDPEPLADPAAVKAAVGGYLGQMRGRIAAAPGCRPQRTQAEQLEALAGDGPPTHFRPGPVEPVRSVEEQLAILLGGPPHLNSAPAALEAFA